MRSFWPALRWFFHPLFLVVLLVGVVGFMVGLIYSVERQDAAVATTSEVPPPSEAAAVGRIAELEAALAEKEAALSSRESELDELQTQLAALRDRTPSAAERADAESRIVSLERALADSSEELNALRSELIDLASQLAEAIQSRDELREQTERARRDTQAERAELEQTIADLRSRLAAAEQQATAAAAGRGSAPAADRPADAAGKPAADEAMTAPSGATGEPVSQGVAAYQAGDYRRAYELWLPPALAGSSRAQFYVGALYFEGRGVEKDLVRSYMWLRAATESDDLGAKKLLDRVRERMSDPDLAEAESRIESGRTIPDR